MVASVPDDAETPWSALTGVDALRIDPVAAPIVAEAAIPGSKSMSNRALILAAFAEGRSALSGLLRSDDTYWCVDALQRLGVGIAVAGTQAQIVGLGRSRPHGGALHVGSAGTAARFLPPFLAAGEAGAWRVSASQQMSRRPVAALFDALRQGGAVIRHEGEPGCYPVRIEGDSFAGGDLSISGAVSSQFISGLLMGAAHTRHGVRLTVEGGIVQSDYVRITLDMMRAFGVEAQADAGFSHFAVSPCAYRGVDLAIEADASTATYFAALAAATRGRITLLNLNVGTRQPDYAFLEILERLGCAVERRADRAIVSCQGPLRGGFSVDMRPLSDAALTLAAIAPFADAPITITGVAHIRHHECDRLAAARQNLTAMGVPVEEFSDGLTVHPGKPQFATLDTFEDHRVAMAFAVLGAAGQGVGLKGPGCVSKTCPSFFEMLGAMGVGVAPIE